MPERYVLDASAGVEILNRTPTGFALAKRTFERGAEEWTVEHFHLEVAKVIRRDVLRGQVSEKHADTLIDGLVRWPLNTVRVAPLLPEAWTMRHNITIHDALYVALARHLNATLITGDRRLANAPGLNVAVIQE
ncbi:type II toxin-antitoxin system VapC family toxin [Phytoactinopolyspora endophytica]|uniref:type II toxin-antitoxin system VapC family toxin n=1 Tax=Phytoactinopolyspora endophytica TaxID=1642495 RepID=UPI00101BC4E6|nr:type II toxin-antitoxin system VapC family toxin [Phytoactinopolyspora endophytica]